MCKDRNISKEKFLDNKKGEKGMIVQDRIFEIPKNKSSEFLKQFNAAKVSEEFLNECRKSAIKTGKKIKKGK